MLNDLEDNFNVNIKLLSSADNLVNSKTVNSNIARNVMSVKIANKKPLQELIISKKFFEANT